MYEEIYAKNYYITLVNNVNLDSVTMEDKDLGFAESGQYDLRNDTLVKKLIHSLLKIIEIILEKQINL